MAVGVPQLIKRGNEIGIPFERLEIGFDRFIQPLERLARVAQMVGTLASVEPRASDFW